MFMLAIVGVCIVLGSLGQIAMKQGMNEVGADGISKLLTPKGFLSMLLHKSVFIGISLYILATILWLFAISKLDISFAYPLLSIGYVLTAIFAFIYLKENITLARWAGITLILIGCSLIIRSG